MRSSSVQKNKSVLSSIPLVTNETARKLINKVNTKVFSIRKVECVFPVVVDSMLPHAGFGPNGYREDAS